MSEFRPPFASRWFFILLFGIFAVAAIALIGTTLDGGAEAPPPTFTVFWLAALAWNAYWWLFRIAYRLQVNDKELQWQAPLRRGAVPLDTLQTIRPMQLTSSIEVIEHRHGRPILVMASKGLRPFLDDLARMRPELPVRPGWQARLSDKLPGFSGWRRR